MDFDARASLALVHFIDEIMKTVTTQSEKRRNEKLNVFERPSRCFGAHTGEIV